MYMEIKGLLPVEGMYSRLDKGRHTEHGQTSAAHTLLLESVTGQYGCLATFSEVLKI